MVRWSHFISSINNKLSSLGIDEDRLIGPYFIKPSEISNIGNIKAKLFLYMWNDVVRHKRKLFFDESINSYGQLLDQYDKHVDVFGVSEVIAEMKQQLVIDNYEDAEDITYETVADTNGDY